MRPNQSAGYRRWAGLVALLGAGLFSQDAFAGAWVKDPGHFYLQLGTGFTTATQRWDIVGKKLPIDVLKYDLALHGDRSSRSISNFQQLETDLYIDIGVLPRLAIFGNIPVVSARQMNPGGDITYSTNSFGDILAGVRLAALVNPLAIAIEARLGFPSGNNAAVLPTGSGDFRGELRVAFGKAFERIPVYFDAEFGYMFRGAGKVFDPLSTDQVNHLTLLNYAPEFAIHFELGGTLLRLGGVDRLLFKVGTDYRGSTQKSSGDAAFSLAPENAELTTVSAALIGVVYRWFALKIDFAQAVEGLRVPFFTQIGGALVANY